VESGNSIAHLVAFKHDQILLLMTKLGCQSKLNYQGKEMAVGIHITIGIVRLDCCAYNEAYVFVADEFEDDFEPCSQMIKIFAKLEMWFRLVHDGCWVCFRSYFWHQFSKGFFLQRNILLIFVTKLKLPKTINPKYFEVFSVLVFLMFWTYICSHLF
jgi:hypothetical protein